MTDTHIAVVTEPLLHPDSETLNTFQSLTLGGKMQVTPENIVTTDILYSQTFPRHHLDFTHTSAL